MRLFSTMSARMTLLRKEGYYMSKQQAGRVVKKLGSVLELTEVQMQKAVVILTCGATDELDNRLDGFTPAEVQVMENLISWYACESTPEKAPCFIALNLNRGYSLVIAEGRDRGISLTWEQICARVKDDQNL